MGIKAMILHGHHFEDFKSVEQICWRCGYVITRGNTAEETEAWMRREEQGSRIGCGGKWHVLVDVDGHP
jgi:hypothetical protein